MTPPWYHQTKFEANHQSFNFHMSHCPHGFSFSHICLVPVPTPILIMSTKSLKILVTKKILLYNKKQNIKLSKNSPKRRWTWTFLKGKAYLQTHDFFIIFQGAMSIPGVSTHMMLHFKDIQKLQSLSPLHPGSFTVCPFKKIPSQKEAGSSSHSHDFSGAKLASNFGGVKSSAKNFCCKIVCFNQATPWHHDNVAGSWNAIPLTSVVQSHSAHLSTGTGTWEFPIRKGDTWKTKPFLGCQNGTYPECILQLSELQIIPKQQETEWHVALNP